MTAAAAVDALMEEREQRRDTFTVKGLVHDSHFYVNARPEVKCCAQQTLTRQTQSKGVLIGASSFTLPPPSVSRTHPRWIAV